MAANPDSNTDPSATRTDYLDALFMCYSAMTVTGLDVVSPSALQPAQQGFLVVLMLLGDISIVALITILCRLSVNTPQREGRS